LDQKIIRSIFILLIASTWSLQVLATKQLPPSLKSATSIANEFRLGITNKLIQMRQNFIEKRINNGAVFYSNKNVVCPLGVKVQKQENLVKYTFSNKVSGAGPKKRNSEVRRFFGCADTVSFVETIVSTGERPEVHSRSEILTGKINFQMGELEQSKDYKIKDGKGVQIFRIHQEKSRNGNRSTTWFYIGLECILKIVQDDKSLFSILKYHFFSILLELDRNGFAFSMNIPSRHDGAYTVKVNENSFIEYFNDKSQRIPMAKFQEAFFMESLDFPVVSVLVELPKTGFISTGSESARMLEELRNAQAWLLIGGETQINLVKLLVDEYIKAVDKGSISDNRPNKRN